MRKERVVMRKHSSALRLTPPAAACFPAGPGSPKAPRHRAATSLQLARGSHKASGSAAAPRPLRLTAAARS